MCLLTPLSAWAWSSQGHQAIAEAAQARLTPAAQAALAQILQATSVLALDALAGTATWPDDIRARRLWHGCTRLGSGGQGRRHLPLGATGYPVPDPPSGDPMRAFVGPDDIVQAPQQAIAILEMPTAPPDFSKAQAVRWLLHLVGDLHQPLHVTTGLVSENETPETLKISGACDGCGGALWTTPHTESLAFRFEVSWATPRSGRQRVDTAPQAPGHGSNPRNSSSCPTDARCS